MTTRSGSTFHIREIKPNDFYFAQLLRQQEKGYVPLATRLILNPEVLDLTSLSQTQTVFKWISENVLDQNVLTVENWLEVSFHLCKQRWDSSVDWLEQQPMSKVQTMMQIVKTHAEEQEKEAKKAAKKKK